MKVNFRQKLKPKPKEHQKMEKKKGILPAVPMAQSQRIFTPGPLSFHIFLFVLVILVFSYSANLPAPQFGLWKKGADSNWPAMDGQKGKG